MEHITDAERDAVDALFEHADGEVAEQAAVKPRKRLVPTPRPRRVRPAPATAAPAFLTDQDEAITRPATRQKRRRPAWLEYERNPRKGEVAESIRSLGVMLATSRGETIPLATLAEQYKGTELGSAYGRIFQGVQSGQVTMADAFKQESKWFPRVVADLLLVGQRSGTSAASLQKAADIIDEAEDMAHKVRSALTQPSILMGVIVLFLYAVIFFVLPVFEDMFSSFGKELPPLSRGLMVAGDILALVGGAGLAVFVAVFVWWRTKGKKQQKARVWLARRQLKIPVIGKVLQAQHLTQMFSVLGGLLGVGMSERDALETAAQSTSSAAIQQHLLDHLVELDRGNLGFADIADGDLVPHQAGFMMRNGFNAGSGVEALDSLASVYRRDAQRKSENLTKALEPVANGIIAVLMAAVLIATYLPVYEMFVGLTEVS